jgi:outer membrane protein assembly factor BamB
MMNLHSTRKVCSLRHHPVLIATTIALLIAAVLPLSGCGIGGRRSSQTSPIAGNRAVGAIGFSVKWPEQTRLVPDAANSIVVTVTRDGNPVATKTINRPTDFPPVPVNVLFADLLVGPDPANAITYTVTATAFPQLGGGGVAQATGTKSIGLSADKPSDSVNVRMGSTITRLSITPLRGPVMRVGETRSFTATGFDASGNIVLMSPSKITWTVVDTAIGNFASSTGNPNNFGATSLGRTQIKATDTESGKTTEGADIAEVVTTSTLGLASSGWGKFHANAQGTGLATQGATLDANPVSRWVANAGSGIELSSPVIGGNGSIYVGSLDGKLYAFTSGGAPKWTFDTGAEIQGSPLVSADGTVYVGSTNGTIYALSDNGGSATVIWQQNLGTTIFGSLNMDKRSYLYVCSDKVLHKIDGLTGFAVWAFDLGTNAQTAPALNSAEDAVFISTVDGRLLAINNGGLQDGKAKWAAPFTTGFKNYSSSPVVGKNNGVETVYFGTVDEVGGGYLYAVDANSGTAPASWAAAFDAEAPVWTTPAVSADGKTVYFGTFDNVTGNKWSRVFAVDTASKVALWPLNNTPDPNDPNQTIPDTFFSDGLISSPALSADGTRLYIGCYDGKVYGLNTTTGMVAWSHSVTPAASSTPNNVDSSIAISSSGTLYVGTFNGQLHAISK